MRAGTLFVVLGDPILDIQKHCSFNGGRFWLQSESIQFGGALNVWKNLKALLPREEVLFTDFIGNRPENPMYEHSPEDLYRIERYWLGDELSFEYTASPSFTYESNHYMWNYPNVMANTLLARGSASKKVLVVSDYGKGTVCNGSTMLGIQDPEELDLVVVDSKYLATDPRTYTHAKCKVLRCTLDENIDATQYEMVKGFDFLIRSEGPHPVVVVDLKSGQSDTVLVPSTTPVVDTCGAGDTMTAVVAAVLGRQPTPIDFASVLEATRIAVELCQEVVQIPGIAITSGSP